MSQSPDTTPTVHQLKVTLLHVQPTAWRRLQVPSDVTLGDLHESLQTVFEWEGGHLHVFNIGRTQYGPAELRDPLSGAFGPPVQNEDSTTVAAVAARPGAALTYTYDLGDDWQHRIEVEDIVPAEPDQVYPRCVDGRGLAPEEDTGNARPGRFDKAALAELNEILEDDGIIGRELAGLVSGPPSDPVFSGLFPEFTVPTDELCDCGEEHEFGDLSLRPYHPVSEITLAELARGCDLVNQALDLARWVGEDRKLTSSLLLRPVDALQAVGALGLARPDLTPGKKLRSAKDLPELHALWSAAVNAGLLVVRDSRANLGPGMRAWADDSEAADQIDSWARLLAGYLRGRVERDSDWQARKISQLLGTTAQLLYTLAAQPIPAGLPALSLLSQDTVDPIEALAMMRDFGSGFESATHDWIRAGILDVFTESGDDLLSPGFEDVQGMLAELAAEASLAGGPAELIIRPLLEAVQESPVVQLTPLGSYGLRRLLLAHGWQVPQIGAYADVPADEILDRLRSFDFDDAISEAQVWLAARGDGWSAAVAEVLESARVDDLGLGADRRTGLQVILYAVGPRVDPTLVGLANDPWLSAVAARARHDLELGPEPTLAEELWLAVDALTFNQDTDADELLEGIEATGVIDVLERPGAVEAAAGLTHPAASATLLLVAEVSGNRQLLSQLRRAFGIKPLPPVVKRRPKKPRKR
jgi:hypothetical protein